MTIAAYVYKVTIPSMANYAIGTFSDPNQSADCPFGCGQLSGSWMMSYRGVQWESFLDATGLGCLGMVLPCGSNYWAAQLPEITCSLGSLDSGCSAPIPTFAVLQLIDGMFWEIVITAGAGVYGSLIHSSMSASSFNPTGTNIFTDIRHNTNTTSIPCGQTYAPCCNTTGPLTVTAF